MNNKKYDYGCFFMDITSNCNLRCKFCSNDWSKIKGNVNMNEETFKKSIELMPLVGDGCFFISCAFEPTIHPNFIELLEIIPKEMKSKSLFTTNLSKKLTLEQLERLSNINIEHINISLDTFNPELFEEFRVGAKFDVFIGNLENLISVFKQNSNSPHLRYITMIFKQNINEAESLVETCFTKYASVHNEFRTPFKFSLLYNDQEWLGKALVSQKEWDEMSIRLSKLSYPIKLFNPPENESVSLINYSSEEQRNYLTFFILSDGTILSPDKGSINLPLEFRYDFNINTIPDPYNYFRKHMRENK